jgi:putative MFS transporter
MSVIWFVVDYNYFMLAFALKYFPGNLYTNGYASSFSDIVAYLCSSYIYSSLGPRKTFVGLSVMSAISGFLMIMCAARPNIFPLLLLMAKFATSAIYNCMYIANADVFPTLFTASGLGITNFFGRIAAMLAPMIVEASFEGGLWLFAILSSI